MAGRDDDAASFVGCEGLEEEVSGGVRGGGLGLLLVVGLFGDDDAMITAMTDEGCGLGWECSEEEDGSAEVGEMGELAGGGRARRLRPRGWCCVCFV